jgi:hypothetical protein
LLSCAIEDCRCFVVRPRDPAAGRIAVRVYSVHVKIRNVMPSRKRCTEFRSVRTRALHDILNTDLVIGATPARDFPKPPLVHV